LLPYIDTIQAITNQTNHAVALQEGNAQHYYTECISAQAFFFPKRNKKKSNKKKHMYEYEQEESPLAEFLNDVVQMAGKKQFQVVQSRGSLVENLNVCLTSKKCSSTVKSMVDDLIYVVSSAHAKKPVNLFDNMIKSYEKMILLASKACLHLQTMQRLHVENNSHEATSEFLKARALAFQVKTLIQHIIDAKFDVSDMKCWSSSCGTQTRAMLMKSPSGHYETVPLRFQNKEWNAKIDNTHTHLDYMLLKGQKKQEQIHKTWGKLFASVGVYVRGNLKRKKRCTTKIKTDYAIHKDKHPFEPSSMYLKDIVRGSLVCKDILTINKALQLLSVYDITFYKDRLQAGTHDVLVNVLFLNVHCEIQMHLIDFYSLQSFSHGPYVVVRANKYTDLLDTSNNLLVSPFRFSQVEMS
jgi:hypothetical protein